MQEESAEPTLNHRYLKRGEQFVHQQKWIIRLTYDEARPCGHREEWRDVPIVVE